MEIVDKKIPYFKVGKLYTPGKFKAWVNDYYRPHEHLLLMKGNILLFVGWQAKSISKDSNGLFLIKDKLYEWHGTNDFYAKDWFVKMKDE